MRDAMSTSPMIGYEGKAELLARKTASLDTYSSLRLAKHSQGRSAFSSP
jgi:hypothetical protein